MTIKRALVALLGGSLLACADPESPAADASGGAGAGATASAESSSSASATVGAGGAGSTTSSASAGTGGQGGAGGSYDCPMGLGEPERVIQIAGGFYHTLALTSRGRVYCWGEDVYAGCMHATGFYWVDTPELLPELDCIASIRTHPRGDPAALTLDGRFLMWSGEGDEEYGDGPGESQPPWRAAHALLPGPAVTGSRSNFGAWAELEDGSRWAWGERWPDAFSDVPELHEGPTAVLRADLVCDLDADGRASCMGENVRGTVGNGTTEPAYQLVPVATDERFRSLTGGFFETFGITLAGEVVSWGFSVAGQLGNGVEAFDEVFPPIKLPGLSNVGRIELDGFHGCALGEDGAVHCWGAGGYGVEEGSFSPISIPDLAPSLGLALGFQHTCSLKTNHTVWCRGALGQRGTGYDDIPPDGSATRVVFPFEE